jgi:hypothetical protein
MQQRTETSLFVIGVPWSIAPQSGPVFTSHRQRRPVMSKKDGHELKVHVEGQLVFNGTF